MDIIGLIYAIGLVPLFGFDSSFISSEATLTTAEKNMGLAIVDKLSSMMGYHLVVQQSTESPHATNYTYCPPPFVCPVPAAGTMPTPSIIQNLDCIIVLDNSESIGQTEFNQAKEAAKKIVKFIETKGPIKPTGSRIGLVEFSSPSQTHVVFGLTSSHLYELEVENAIGNLGYDAGGSTATERALAITKTEFQLHNSHFNARTAWILTDGNSNIGGDPAAAAQQLTNMGVTVCAVAVGSSVNMNEIKAIGSKECTFNPATFSKLSELITYGIVTRAHQLSNPTLPPNFFSGINLGKRLLQLLKKRYDNSEDSKNLA